VEDGERVVADDVGEGVAGVGPDHRVVVAVAVVPVGGHICLRFQPASAAADWLNSRRLSAIATVQ